MKKKISIIVCMIILAIPSVAFAYSAYVQTQSTNKVNEFALEVDQKVCFFVCGA